MYMQRVRLETLGASSSNSLEEMSENSLCAHVHGLKTKEQLKMCTIFVNLGQKYSLQLLLYCDNFYYVRIILKILKKRKLSIELECLVFLDKILYPLEHVNNK